jgi:histidine triad (HIT) family protein
MKDCLFCKIANGEKPAKKVYEDDEIFAFHDINPQAPTHILLIPKQHLETIEDASPEMLGKLVAKASEIARDIGISEKGYRTVINCRDHAGQSVYHLHVHLLGGRWFHWPPG